MKDDGTRNETKERLDFVEVSASTKEKEETEDFVTAGNIWAPGDIWKLPVP
jgi:hypothetical protein